MRWWNGGGDGLHTIPELLFIVQGVRHLKLHCSSGDCHDQNRQGKEKKKVIQSLRNEVDWVGKVALLSPVSQARQANEKS